MARTIKAQSNNTDPRKARKAARAMRDLRKSTRGSN